MARSPFQKLKILYVMDYLLKYSDEQHPVTVAQLIAELDARGISAERKSIYDDIDCLREYGLDIIATGTPAGVGIGFDPPRFLQPGDEVVCSIEGVGSLKNTIA